MLPQLNGNYGQAKRCSACEKRGEELCVSYKSTGTCVACAKQHLSCDNLNTIAGAQKKEAQRSDSASDAAQAEDAGSRHGQRGNRNMCISGGTERLGRRRGHAAPPERDGGLESRRVRARVIERRRSRQQSRRATARASVHVRSLPTSLTRVNTPWDYASHQRCGGRIVVGAARAKREE